MINNFELIRPLLSFNSPDEFYFVQIYQRKKDNPDIKFSERVIKFYYIDSIALLDYYEKEMILLANAFNARVGINLNKRSFEKTAFNTMQKIVNQLINKDFRSVKGAYNHACGIRNFTDDKIWIIDIDKEYLSQVDEIKSTIVLCKPLLKVEEKILAEIPSKTGVHILTRPFDLPAFKYKYSEIDIHKNNPVNMYIA